MIDKRRDIRQKTLKKIQGTDNTNALWVIKEGDDTYTI